jgi:hypothetical protein
MFRVVRGGNFSNTDNELRSSWRRDIWSSMQNAKVGFRVAMTGPLP